MPIGSYAVSFHVVAEMEKKQPRTILDLGIGYGFLSACVRQWLDAGVEPFQKVLIGVEGFPKYRNPQWNLYNEVYEMTIQTFLHKNCMQFDCIVFSDVIEHFSKVDGVIILEQLKKLLNPGGILLVGTPGVFCEQGSVHGNELETHRSLWTAEDFPSSQGWTLIKDGEPDEFKHRMVLAKWVM